MSYRPRSAASQAATAVLRRAPELSPANSPPRHKKRQNTRGEETWPTNSLVTSDGENESAVPSSVRFAYGGRVHSLLLSSDLSATEAQNIVRAVFSLREPVVGVFEPEREIVFPFSLVVREPASFPAVYFLMLERSGLQACDIPREGEDSSPALSPESSPQASPQRIAPKALQQLTAEPKQTSNHAVVPRTHRTNAAFSKAQELARLAAASPGASDDDDHDSLSELSTDYSQPEDDGDEQAAFEAAVERALRATHQKQNQQPQQNASRPTTAQHQQLALRAQELEEKLLRELGDYDDGGSDLPPEMRGAESAAAEAMRQTFWERQREQVYLEAERRALAASEVQLQEQRATIARLRAEQAHLQKRQADALAAVQAHEAREDAAKRATVRAANNKATAATALKQAVQGRMGNTQQPTRYDTFEASEEEDEEFEDEESEEDSEEPSLPAPYPYESDADDAPSGAAGNSTSRFVLSEKELVELADLQVQTGFASVAPSALFALFRERCGSDGRIGRQAFDSAASSFARQVRPHLADDAAARKAVLVLSRLYDLFASPQDGRVAFKHFATGLSVLVQGDRDEKIRLAFAAFDPEGRGSLPFSAVEDYLLCFFKTVFDLSVSLQEAILPHATPSQLAHATTVQMFAASTYGDHLSFAQFRQWYSDRDESRQPQSFLNGSDESNDSDQDQDSLFGSQDEDQSEEDAQNDYDEGAQEDEEQDEATAIARAAEAAEEARHFARQLQEQQARFRQWQLQDQAQSSRAR